MASLGMQRDAVSRWNALSSTRWQMNAAAPPNICAFGEYSDIVFREADPPSSMVERVVRNALGNSLIGLSAPRTRQK
jgi:hypothetical protein